ncbi:hypothetical protein YE105_C0568 [Yersinia enterocolitica subsp. palearctica 105.5R(r)]|nr:hypothetical protein YE105_C0568 [Yersinia enterocolitica subsp. palearctica 105.5R(r)]
MTQQHAAITHGKLLQHALLHLTPLFQMVFISPFCFCSKK